MRLTYVIVFLFLFSCQTKERIIESDPPPSTLDPTCFDFSGLEQEDLMLADSILYVGLQNEALHTLISDLKPMSDVMAFPFYLEEPDSIHSDMIIMGSERFMETFSQLNRITDAFQCDDLRAGLFPFRNVFNGKRHVQLRVFRADAVDRMLDENPDFWSKWAFTPGANPETLIQTIEFESMLDRFRGYGYLYGYPSHAVDFFVASAAHQDETGEFVERDFLSLPVVSGQSGRFVYAVEKGHTRNEADLRIYDAAAENVRLFNEHSSSFYEPDSTFRAAEFLRFFQMRETAIY